MVNDPKRYPNLKPSRRSVRYGTYDEWKLANPDDDLDMTEAEGEKSWLSAAAKRIREKIPGEAWDNIPDISALDWPASDPDADDDPV